MTTEYTRIEDGFVDLGGQQEATFRQGVLYIRQDMPAIYNQETIELDTHAQMALLKALYERRYVLYRATTLSLGGDDVPDWIASGKSGSVTRIVDATNELDQAELLPADYQTQKTDHYLVSVYAGRYVIMRYDGHSWKQVSEIKTPEARNLVASMVPLGKKGGFLYYRSAQVAEQEYQYPEQQSSSHVIHENRED